MRAVLPATGGVALPLSRRNFLGRSVSTAAALALPAGCAPERVVGRDSAGYSDTASTRSVFTMTPVNTAATVAHPAQLGIRSDGVWALSARDLENSGPATNAVVALATGTTVELPAEGNANYILKVSTTTEILLYNGGFYVRNNGKLGEKITYQQGTLGNSAIVIGDKLFITTTGLTTGTPQYVTGGHVLVYNVSDLSKTSDQIKSIHTITTAGTNPTGLGVFSEVIDGIAHDRLVVMQSGGANDKQASVRVYDPSGNGNEYRLLKTLKLPDGDIGQSDHVLQIDSDGNLYVGTANAPLEDGTGNFYKIDLYAGADDDYIVAEVNLGTNYNNAVVLDEANGYVYVASYNEGKVQILDATTLEVLDQKLLNDAKGNPLFAGPLVLASDPKNPGTLGVMALAVGGLFWIGEDTSAQG